MLNWSSFNEFVKYTTRSEKKLKVTAVRKHMVVPFIKLKHNKVDLNMQHFISSIIITGMFC